MLYADNAGIASISPEGLEMVMVLIVIVTRFEAAGLTVPKKETETMKSLKVRQVTRNTPLAIEAADQRYKQTTQ